MRSRSLLSAPFRFLPHFKCAQSRCDGKMTRGGRHNAPDLAHNHLGLCVLPASTYLQTLFLLPGCSQPLGCVLLAYNQVEARPFLTTLDFRPATTHHPYTSPPHTSYTHTARTTSIPRRPTCPQPLRRPRLPQEPDTLKQSLAANYSLVFRWAPCSTSTAAAAKQKEEDEQQQEEDKGGDFRRRTRCLKATGQAGHHEKVEEEEREEGKARGKRSSTCQNQQHQQ